MTLPTIDRTLATRILELVDAGLSNGKGIPQPGKMCVEAVVCFAMGLPHGDAPPCVAHSVRAFKIELNDRAWSSKTARAQGMRRVAIAQLGSMGVVVDDAFWCEIKSATRVLATRRLYRSYIEKLRNFKDWVAKIHTQEEDFKRFAEVDLAKAQLELNTLHSMARTSVDTWTCTNMDIGPEKDAVLAEIAECAVQVLIKLGSPGAEFLDLAPLPKAA